MVWSNWQGAIWRGAGLMLLFWAGLAWTQTPAQRSATDPTEHTMVVHENGKSMRCRILETWQLPDGRKAHLLEALDTGEKVTIIAEASAPANPRAMPIRIFSWGLGRHNPPDGSPLPPHLRLDSGVVIKNETPFPVGGVMGEGQGPVIINRADDTPLGGSFAGPGPRLVERGSVRPTSPGLLARMLPNRTGSMQKPDEPQMIQFPGAAGQTPAPLPNPLIQAQAPGGPGDNTVVQALGKPGADDKGIVNAKGTDSNPGNPLVQTQGTGGPINPSASLIINGNNTNPSPGTLPGTPLPPAPGIVPATPLPPPPGIVPGVPLPPPGIVPGMPSPPPPLNTQPPTNVQPPAPSVGNPLLPAAGVLPSAKPGVDSTPSVRSPSADPAKPVEAKKSWRPGEKITGWWQSKSAKPEAKPELPPDPVVVNPQAVKADDKILPPAKVDDKVKKADDFLTEQNKVAEKQQKEKMERIYKGVFSTAMNPATPPEMKKPEPTPLAMPNSTAPKEEKPAIVAPLAPPPLANVDLKPATGSEQERRDMFGTGANQVAAPGRSVLDTPGLVKLPPPPVPRRDDPLMALDRLPIPAKANMNVLPPIARETRPAPAPEMGAKNPWPPGAQSVLAARNGLEGPVAYIPVPTVTVPQPNHPPVPPAPMMPDAPQLNANVNAFSAQPAPRSAPQMPQQGMMPAQAMMPYGNPMMQSMPPYGYGYPQPAYAMNPYGPQGPMMNPMMAQQMPYRQPMMVSQGPTANYARQYMGPLPPQNPFAPTMPAGYGYPPMMPQQQMQQPMMPQQPMIQPAGYQQMMQTPAAQTQQVEQLIKVMRENAYPAQREWAAQMLASYEWRMHPQIVPALLQSAAQDPAATVRAGCVTCLGRIQAAVEPVFGTLHAMRSDIDPRVRSAVEQAFVQLGQTPMAPQ